MLGRYIKPVVLVLFFIYFFISLVKIPLYNNDFWWHIANGRYISETHSLPDEDPFAYTTNKGPSQRKSVILKGYWLAQLAFFEIFDEWGAGGIIILRAFVLILFLYFIFLNIRKQRTSFLLSLFLVTCVFVIAKESGGERPQLFTFLVFSVTYYLLEDLRSGRSKRAWIIPFLVMMLSNMHPGYIVCILLMSVYVVGEGLRRYVKKDIKGGIFAPLLALLGLTVVLSMFNPLGVTMLTRPFSSLSGDFSRSIVEFMPTFKLYIDKVMPVHIPYIFFLALSLLVLRYRKEAEPSHILALLLFTAMSIIAARFVIFYMAVSAPILGNLLMRLKDKRMLMRVKEYVRGKELIVYFCVAVVMVGAIFFKIPSLIRYGFRENTEFSVPSRAADFLARADIRGNMFNEYGFGGYLIWRLWPAKKVFIDGRLLDESILYEYNAISSAVQYRNETWEQRMERYDITHVVMPPLSPNGDIYPLVETLFDKDDWTLIYYDHLTLIFIKKGPENAEIIQEHGTKKEDGLNTIIVQASARAMQNAVNHRYLISLGKTFYRMGRIDDARKAFLLALQRAPDDRTIQDWLSRLDDKK